MLRYPKRGFTLVELIVVVTILWILATLGFVSYSSYLITARDTSRTSAINSITNGMISYSSREKLPIPDDSIEILAGGKPVAWQWYAWKNVLQEIEYSKSWLDPKNDVYYSYYLSDNRQDFQLLIYLEDRESSNETYGYNSSSVHAADTIPYSSRIPYVYWNNLGILTNQENRPIQELEIIKEDDYLDILHSTGSYKAFITNDFIISGTGAVLQDLERIAWNGGTPNSCKSILLNNAKTKGKDGFYYINLDGPRKVYCDMTDQWWGWTRYADIKANYSFEEAKKCWLWNYESSNIDCFNPNQYNFTVNHFKVTIWWLSSYKKFTNEIPSKIYNTSNGSYECRGGREYMTVMKNWSIPSLDLEGLNYIRLWLNYCDENGYESWGFSVSNSRYMNYSSTWNSPAWSASRSSSVVPTQLFIR